MSQENVEIVRQPIAVSAASRPRLGEQLFLRLPRVAAVLTRVALRRGVPIVIHFWGIWTIREGKVREIEYFRHRADAIHVAGLQE